MRPGLLPIDEQSVVQNALITMRRVRNLYRAELRLAVRQVSNSP